MEELSIQAQPSLSNPPLILGFTGWMDAGNVSTGAVRHIVDTMAAEPLAAISPLDFYILNFPVSTVPITVFVDGEQTRVSNINPMEFSAVFRPHTEIKDGVIKQVVFPSNEFHYAKNPDLILFRGEEPHIRWGAYSECIFELTRTFGVSEIYFIGSVSSPIPHTREPRLRCSSADPALNDRLRGPDVQFTDYSGPSGLITYMSRACLERGIAMRNIVVEVPHYPFLDMPNYPRSILKVLAKLSELLGLSVDLSTVEAAARQTDGQLQEIMEENGEFKTLVEQLEVSYDYEEADDGDTLLKRLIDGIDLRGPDDED